MGRSVSSQGGQWPYALTLTLLLLFSLSPTPGEASQPAKPPNIIFIVADDLGFNDVSWNNPEVMTPNMQHMVDHGVLLEQAYAQAACTPSRAAYLTGYYPFRIGVQNAVVREGMADYLPLDLTFLPKRLKEAGYSTHLVGKWHLGHCRRDVTPNARGFDTFLGVLNGYSDFYTKKIQLISGHEDFDPNAPGTIYDFFLNYDIYPSPESDYTTDIFTNRTLELMQEYQETPFFIALHYTAPHWPLKAPDDSLHLYPNVTDQNRRTYLQMVTAMDEGIGVIHDALLKLRLHNNTVIMFQSDNGGAPTFGASNSPLKGVKGELYEGGTRTPAFVYSPHLLANTPRVSQDLFHVVDWFSTILGIAGVPPGNVDGVNHWEMLRDSSEGSRKTFIYNIFGNNTAIRAGRFKLIEGDPTEFEARRRRRRRRRSVDDTQHQDLASSQTTKACPSRRPMESDMEKVMRAFNQLTGVENITEVRKAGEWTVDKILNYLATLGNDSVSEEAVDCFDCQLYDLEADPSERESLTGRYPAVVLFLHHLLDLYKAEEVESVLKTPYQQDPRSEPALADNITSNTWCEDDAKVAIG